MNEMPPNRQPTRARTAPLDPAIARDDTSASFNCRRAETFGDRSDTMDADGSFARKLHSDESSFQSGSYINRKSRALMSQHTVSNLLSVNFATGNDKAKFKDEVVAVKRRLRESDRRTINPNSRYMRMWDFIVIAALFTTALITPFEVAFFHTLVYAGPANFAMNRIIDAIFLVDIGVTFFLPYRTSMSKGGMLIFDRRRIACNYLTGWFTLDLITCIPFDLIFAGIAAVSGATIKSSFVRMLRVLRVLKLARILRASRILNRWRDHIALSFATTSLSFFIFITCLLAHWYVAQPTRSHRSEP